MTGWILDHLILISLLTIGAVLASVIGIFRYFHRLYREESTRPAIAGAVVNIIFAVLFSLWLNNLFALKRERDARLWGLRQEHLNRLRPVLRTDAQQLRALADRMTALGYLAAPWGDATSAQQEYDHFWSHDVLAAHLLLHFREYYQARENLRMLVVLQDKEYRDALAQIESKFTSSPSSLVRRTELSLSLLERCTGEGPGITLETFKDAFNYRSRGHTVTGRGRPPRDIVATVRAFQAFQPDPAISGLCSSLSCRSHTITVSARKLSERAALLAEGTNLEGTCKYVRID
jgi:hypothetical protein